MNKHEGVLHDLNDLRLFAAVVEHGGYSAAGRALATPKSRLSKRIAQLEERLGVRLLQRTTRRFAVTAIGERFYAQCRIALDAAQAAQDVVDELRAEPRGIVRMSCPVALAQTFIAHVLPDFLQAHPQVQVRIHASDRRVDLIGEGYDLALRVRDRLDEEPSLVARTFGQSRLLLVASPAFLDQQGRPRQPADLAGLPLLSRIEQDGPHTLELADGGGARASVALQPRIACGDFAVLLESAMSGCGVATLTEFMCAEAIERGDLELVLPGWNMPQGIMHLVYASRRGQLPSVRALVEFLAQRLPQAVRELHDRRVARPTRAAATRRR
ncbi:MAG: LysR family transcriptional regulator [Rhodanobacteraceae bacterium]|nr:LysR family transcriptional regulator [Rhodanobacteraceae bacterium]